MYEYASAEEMCKSALCTNKALENGYCEIHNQQSTQTTKQIKYADHRLFKLILSRTDINDILLTALGVNGLVAVTKTIVYVARGGIIERKAIKSYSIPSITSIEIRKPNPIVNGHFQIITVGNSDRTSRFATAFSYARDDNSIMIRSLFDDFDDFLKIEKLIYELRDNSQQSQLPSSESIGEDVFTKIEKLSSLRDRQIITSEEFEQKKKKLLSKL